MEARDGSLATEAEYLVRENAAETKHEFLNGRIVAMSGASYWHAVIALNIGSALKSALRGRPCKVTLSDVRVNVSETGLYTYPDLSVVCGPPLFSPRDPLSIRNPLLLVEVLSDSTEGYDRGAKFAHYRRLPSLQEYLLVSQTERRVELYRRIGEGTWQLTEQVGEGALRLASIEVELALAEVYEKVELPPGNSSGTPL